MTDRRIEVPFLAPIRVVVNTDTETVEQVIVDQDGIRFDVRSPLTDHETGRPVNDQDVAAFAAFGIANSDEHKPWPAWDTGQLPSEVGEEPE